MRKQLKRRIQAKNEELESLIKTLLELSGTQNRPFWKKIALELAKPSRKKRVVNVYKIDKFADKAKKIVVPGKVLGTGEISKGVEVFAYSYSQSAYLKILKAGGKAKTIQDLIAENPKDFKDILILV